MGYQRHHGILVTSWDDKLIEKAHAEAVRIYARGHGPFEGSWEHLVSPVSGAGVNGFRSFAVFPDGSKEWDASDEGDRCRRELVEWLDAQRYDDGSTSVDWVEVQYGDDEKQTLIVSHSDAPQSDGSRADG